MVLLEINTNPSELLDAVQVVTAILGVIGILVILSALQLQATTLQLQQQQLSEQQKMTEIEQKRFSFQIRPEFKIQYYYLGTEGQPNIKAVPTNAPARHLRVHAEKQGKYYATSETWLEFTFHIDDFIDFTFSFNPDYRNTTLESKIGTLLFQDELEITCYQQEVWIKHGKPYITLPRIIPEYVLVPGSKPYITKN